LSMFPALSGRVALGGLAAIAGLVAVATGDRAAEAGVGDLLVAPTRIVLNGSRGTEIILKNVGDKTATYRVSAELRRMTPEGQLVEVKDPTAEEKTAQEMLVFAPRKVTLPPNQPQAIRVAARPPAGLADGEYRVHLMFRAIPDATPVTEVAKGQGLSFKLTPIYRVTIPVIVRLGSLEAKAAMSDVALAEGGKAVKLKLSRSGNRSTYGELRLMKPGVKEPVGIVKGVAVYKEMAGRSVTVPFASSYKGDTKGALTVQYFEVNDAGSTLSAEVATVLR